MAYKGNYQFDDNDMIDEGVCTCCGEPCSMLTTCYDDDHGMYYDSEFYPRYEDGELIIAEYDNYYLSSNCDCDQRHLREKCEEWGCIHLDGYGHKLLQILKEVDELKHINEFDVCRLSEIMGKSFKDVLEFPIDTLVWVCTHKTIYGQGSI